MPEPTAPAQDPQNAVLPRIIAAHRRDAIAARDRSGVLSNAWVRALRRAGQPFSGLNLTAGDVDVTEHADLATLLGALPQHGLVSVLEDRDGRRGLIAISHGMVDALVEVQTTGQVESRNHPPRPVTRIDEALCRDFVDLSLAALSHETDQIEDRDWPRRMTYGSHVADLRQLTLLLSEAPYHVLSAQVRLGEDGGRDGIGLIALPSDPDLVDGRPPAPVGRAPGPAPEDWRAVLARMLDDSEIMLEAVLLKTKRSLYQIERLEAGDLISFSTDDLAAVELRTPGGHRILDGRLGQINGMRALRVQNSVVSGSGAAPETLPGQLAQLDTDPSDMLHEPIDAGAAPPTGPSAPGFDDGGMSPLGANAAAPEPAGVGPTFELPADDSTDDPGPKGGPVPLDGLPGEADEQPFAPAPMPLDPGMDFAPDPMDEAAPTPLDFTPKTAAIDPGDFPE